MDSLEILQWLLTCLIMFILFRRMYSVADPNKNVIENIIDQISQWGAVVAGIASVVLIFMFIWSF